jgi:diguanylate cyclase (GGDEF)-like protein
MVDVNNTSKRILIFFLIALSALWMHSLFSFPDQSLTDANTVSMSNWQFCQGKLQQPKADVCEKADKPPVIKPSNAGQKGTHYTYFTQYTIKESMLDQEYALNLGPVGDEDEVWIDGKRVGKTIYNDTGSIGFQDWTVHMLDAEFLTPGIHDVVIQVRYLGPMYGGVLNNPTITTAAYAQIKKTRHNFYRSYLPFAFSVALFLLSLYSGLVGVFGKNKSSFYDYMGFGICFSMYVGSIGFVYTYIGFNWTASMLLFSLTILGTVYFSIRLALSEKFSAEKAITYNRRSNIFFFALCSTLLMLLLEGMYLQIVLILEFFFCAVVSMFCYAVAKNGLVRLQTDKTSPFAWASIIVSASFFIGTSIDVYKQFMAPDTIFVLPYALILLGFFIMLNLANDHVKALRDQQLKDELEIKNQKLKYLSEHDPLTSLYNRRTFESLVEYHINDANEHKGYALMILDIDHFKAYNDSYGHPAGDSLLVTFAQVLHDAVRLSDPIGRLGGEEFGIFIHNVTFEQAKQIAESVRKSIENTQFEHRQQNGSPVTASIGGIYFAPKVIDIKYTEAYKTADQCLYKAKEKRNTVVMQHAKKDNQTNPELVLLKDLAIN